jgi:hypothetical protein
MVIQLNSMLGIGMMTMLLLFPGFLKQGQSEAASEEFMPESEILTFLWRTSKCFSSCRFFASSSYSSSLFLLFPPPWHRL